jgi:hypothetical protein
MVMRERKTADMVEHRKLRINTRLKVAGMLNRKKYGADPVPVGGNTLIMPMPEAYREAINRALGFTGELKPLGMEAGQVVEAKVSEFLPE